VVVKGIRPSGADRQCPWVVSAGKASEPRYLEAQGDLNPEPRLEVETTLNGKCLWIYYLPSTTALPVADLTGAEIHEEGDEAPGTYEAPLTFTGTEIMYGGAWQSFVPVGAGTSLNPDAPVPNYQANHEIGCQSAVPYWGAHYKFGTWGKNSYGACAPWALGNSGSGDRSVP
jgi:hypothetical protein